LIVDAQIEDVWVYVSNIGNWAGSMPGYQSFEEIDDRHSKWELKVSLGALTRAVSLGVEIGGWREPGHVDFMLHGERDPIDGRGSFDARASGGRTEVAIKLQIQGRGPMASTMEAMSGRVLSRMADGIVAALLAGVTGRKAQADAPVSGSRPGRSIPLARLLSWLGIRRTE
jgi:carbon monoxide dehydrogenase subunit G